MSPSTENTPFIKNNMTMQGNLGERHRDIVMQNESLGRRLIARTPSVNNRKLVKD